MRTTLTIDDDVLSAARSIAAESGAALGSVISELARKGLKPSAAIEYRNDFPVFEIREDAEVFGPAEVREALDEE